MRFIWIISVFVFGLGQLFADLQSTTNSIKFDSNSDANHEAVLDNTGLAIGEAAASANLHVSGNAVIETGNIGIGVTSANSSLEVSGSLGFNVESTSSNTVLSTNSMVLADTSSNDVVLTLPYAGNVTGRQYTIKKMSQSNILQIQGGGNSIDNLGSVQMSSGGNKLPHVELISDGSQWYILSEAQSVQTIASDNLVGWWRLDETSGTTASDSGSLGLDGTLTGGFTFQSNGFDGKVSRALDFDGDDVITVNDNDGHSFVSGGSENTFSLACWFQVASTSTYSPAGKASAVQTGEYYLLTSSNDLYMRIVDNGSGYIGKVATNVLSNNTWFHVVGTYTGSASEAGIKLYLNGALQSVGSAGGGTYTVMENTATNFKIGERNTPLIGKVDDVRLYNKVLSADEVMSLYQSGGN